ncbi:MAG: S8 family peptidase [bacterium]|nr:S8 family peptidase [bacterium]
MDSQKAENLLNLALSVTEEERRASEILQVGFDEESKRWELIIRCRNDLEEFQKAFPQVAIYPLWNSYAVLSVPQQQVEAVTAWPDIMYVEKPKQLYFELTQGKAASCINPLQYGSKRLSGKGVLIAIIDSGIDYRHSDFRNENGKTRILKLWDQNTGKVYGEEEINEALEKEDSSLSVDLSGHGTAVAGIAAGNGSESKGAIRGIAYESKLLVVKLGNSESESFPRTTQLMRGVQFVAEQAEKLRMPLVINLSFGNSYGSHDGSSLLESYLDAMADSGRYCIVTGSGNEGSGEGHYIGRLTAGREEMAELSVAPYESGLNLQIWKSYLDTFGLILQSPSGVQAGPISPVLGSQELLFEEAKVLLYYGKPSPYSMAQEIFLDFLPRSSYLGSGIWKIRFLPEKIVDGRVDLWLPVNGVRNRATRFLQPNPDTTLTIPSTAAKLVSVGAYNSTYASLTDFSGNGFTRDHRSAKPDLVAPGVGIVTTHVGGGYEAVTGTSFAAPFVTGTAALLMEWGLLQGNDPYLYGEKMKAFLLRGAKDVAGITKYPDPLVGYGALCAADSLT